MSVVPDRVIDFRQTDADELHRNSDAVFGTWERREADGRRERTPGILERLERIEWLIKVAIAAAAGLGAVGGSVVTLVIQHFFFGGK